jgi:hypothetical protein
MTKKDYELIASVIRLWTTGETRIHLAFKMSEALKGTNPRFDAERFYAACFPKEKK